MSDIHDTQSEQPDPKSDQRPAAFCQQCGKSLNKETARVVGTAVFCEPCLHEKLTGAPPAGTGYTPVNSGVPYGADAWTSAPYAAGTAASAWNGSPNPGLAFLLGLIPGVGAMYNEQYAKGLVHLVIFAILVMFSHISGIFGLFIAGWVFYMAIEAHHTARAKRDGTPLPNPFGLNDIGERMGFAPSWINGQGVATAVEDAAAAAGFRPGTGAPPPPQPGAASSSATWGAPVDAYPNPTAYGQTPYAAQPTAGYAQPYTAYGANMPPYGAAYAPPGVSAIPTPVSTGPIPPPIVPGNRFPMGAVWLIGLGALFLLGTEGIFSGIRGETLAGFVILALGVTVFVRRMTAFGGRIEDDGSPDYHFRLLYALRAAVWLLMIGVLFLLDGFRVLYWSHSWPLLIIAAGVMMLLRRVPVTTAAPSYPYTAPAYPEPYPPASEAAAGDAMRLNLRPDPTAPTPTGSDNDPLNGGR